MLKAVYAADDVRCAVIFIDTAVAIVRSRCLMTVIKPDYIDPHKLRRPDAGEARPISAPDTRHKRLSDISAIKRHKDNHLTAAAHGGHLNSHRPSSTADVMLPAVFAFRLIHSMCLTSALDTLNTRRLSDLISRRTCRRRVFIECVVGNWLQSTGTRDTSSPWGGSVLNDLSTTSSNLYIG